MTGAAAGAAAAALLALAACGEVATGGPSAVIRADPSAICLGDGFVTPVRLDGEQSRPRLSLVPQPPSPGAPPLSWRWTLSGSDARIVEGGLDDSALVVLLRGDRPLHVGLEVSLPDRRAARSQATVAVTLPDPAAGICSGGP